MRLLLIRHGQTTANVGGILDTKAPGPSLTELGREQAAALPEALAGAGIEALFVSTLVRTHQTIAPLAAALGLEPVELAGLREVEAGTLEDRADQEAYDGYIGPLHAWVEGDLSVRVGGGEDGHDFLARYDEAIRAVAASGAAVAACVSHGAAIRTWSTARGLADGGQFLRDHELGNTGVVTLEGDPDAGWELVAWEGTPAAGGAAAAVTADPTGRG